MFGVKLKSFFLKMSPLFLQSLKIFGTGRDLLSGTGCGLSAVLKNTTPLLVVLIADLKKARCVPAPIEILLSGSPPMATKKEKLIRGSGAGAMPTGGMSIFIGNAYQKNSKTKATRKYCGTLSKLSRPEEY